MAHPGTPGEAPALDWTPALESELRFLLREQAKATRQSLAGTPALRDLESIAGFYRIPIKDGSDMEDRYHLWECWLIRQLPERLLAPFLSCAGLTQADIEPPKGNRKSPPRKPKRRF